MSSLAKSFAASFIGKIWTASMSLVFLPYYIHWIGFEAYGLVGVYTTLLALFSVLDLGLGSSITREMARISPGNPPEEFRNLTRSLEVIYWAVAILIGTGVVFAAPYIAHHWIQAKALSGETVKQSLYLAGLALTFLWPSSLYAGGLIGLQRQVLLNKLVVAVATLRGVGLLVILAFISPTIQAFFLWQIFINGLQTTLTAMLLWKNIPRSSTSPRFDWGILGRLKKYAAGIAGVTVIGVLFSHVDKVILSRALPLETFGYYSLATTIAGALFHITGPIYSVCFPRFSQLIALNDAKSLKHIYHFGCQLMSTLIIPSSLFLVLFSREFLFLWTQSPETVDNANLLVKLLVTGTMLNALLYLPTALQYAFGWTQLTFYMNLLSFILMVPFVSLTASRFGAEGAGWSWAAINALLLFGTLHFMHRRIIHNEKLRWYIQDVGLPLGASLSVLGVGRMFLVFGDNFVMSVVQLLSIFLLSLLAAFSASSHVRQWMKSKWRTA
jgi:O-antigen/teichoic acid export membrane protein